MRASTIMGVAVLLYIVHRWATPGETAIDARGLVGGAFAILVIAMLDTGKTEEIAKGFAWLFLAGAAYKAIPSIASAAKTQKAPARPKPGPTVTIV